MGSFSESEYEMCLCKNIYVFTMKNGSFEYYMIVDSDVYKSIHLDNVIDTRALTKAESNYRKIYLLESAKIKQMKKELLKAKAYIGTGEGDGTGNGCGSKIQNPDSVPFCFTELLVAKFHR